MEETHSNNGDVEFLVSTAKCYISLLDGYCKSRSRGSELKAEELLCRMNTLSERIRNAGGSGGGGGDSGGSDNSGNNGSRGGSGRSKKGIGIADVRHYNNVLNRIATSHKPNAGQECERLLHELIELYKSTKDESLRPNRVTFNTVIKGYVNSGNSGSGSSGNGGNSGRGGGGGGREGKTAARNAKRIFSMMENPESIGLSTHNTDGGGDRIEPDKVSCTSILQAWANSGENDTGEKAERLLERMQDMYIKGNEGMKPDGGAYNAVIKVW